MNSKTLSTYLIGAVAGLGLAVGSVAFAQNTGYSNNHHDNGAMGQTTQQTTHNGMHGQAIPQTAQNGMHGQAIPQATQGGMHGSSSTHAGANHYNSNTHCNSAVGSQDKKS